MGKDTESLRLRGLEDANSKEYKEYLRTGHGDLVEADCQITGGGSSSSNKLLKKVGAVLGVTIPALAVLGACGVDKPAVIEESPEPGEIEKSGNGIPPTEVTPPAEKPTETPGFDDEEEDNGRLQPPESFINFIKNWGYSDVKYIGQRTLGNINLDYAYECKTSDGEVVWSVVGINLNDGSWATVYDLHKNPLG